MSLSLQRRLVLNFFAVSLVSMLVVAYIPLTSYNLVLEEKNKSILEETATDTVRAMNARLYEAIMLASQLARDEAFITNFRSETAPWSNLEQLQKIVTVPLKPNSPISIVHKLEPHETALLEVSPDSQRLKNPNVPQVLDYEGFPVGSRYVLGRLENVFVQKSDMRVKIGGVVVGEPFTERSLRSMVGTTDVEVQLIDGGNKAFINHLRPQDKRRLFEEQRVAYLSSAATQGTKLVYQARLVPVVNQHGDTVKIIVFRLQQPASLMAWSELKTHFGASILAGIAIALMTGYMVSRSISRPVRTLVSGVREASEGNLGQYIVSEREDEVGELAKNFNVMTERLRASLRQLQERAQMIEEKNVMLQHALDELTRMRDYMENILSSIKSGVITLDLKMNITTANLAAAQILGVPNVPLGPARDCLDGVLLQIAREGLARGRTYGSMEVVLEQNGDRRVLDVSTSLLRESNETIGVVVTFKDLTEIKTLEAQILRQERLAALGQLSAGVAHEIRNPLGIIKGSAELLQKRFAHLPEEEGLTEFIIDEVKRLSKVVTNFLEFARPKDPLLQQTDINAVLGYTVDMIEKQSNADRFQFVRDLTPDALTVNADREQFQQVFINLILNGMDAMPEGGTIAVRSRLSSSEGAPVVEIEDHGTGIPKADLEKVFNPFYTTKENGTGLGLSIVHNIIQSHGARLKVNSVEGRGTVFRIVFPTTRGARQTPVGATREERT